jgi:hypothetical protein
MQLEYKIIINSTEYTVTPLLKVTFKGQKSGMNYSRELANAVTFIKSDYSLIVSAFSDCSKIGFQILKDASVYYSGYFKRTDCKIDEDLCLVKVTMKTDNCLDGFQKSIEKEYSPYGSVTAQNSKAYLGDLETVDMVFESKTFDSSDQAPVLQPPSDPANWCATPLRYSQSVSISAQEQEYTFSHVTTWARVKAQGTSTTPPAYGSGWTYISGNNWFRCVAFQIVSLKNGRTLKGVIEFLLSQFTDCSLTLKSYFFGWNVSGDTPLSSTIANNIAYQFADDYLKELVLHQKSDVKRPYDSRSSQNQAWKIKLKELLGDLKLLLNVEWVIESSILRVEHISYFEKQVGITANGAFRKKFSYEVEDITAREAYKYADDSSSAAFAAKDIEYDCITENKADEYKLTLLHTDIAHVQNPENDKRIRDEGFVLVATETAISEHFIINGNLPLSYPVLHENLFRHGRKFPTGKINNAATTFLSSQKTKKQESIRICRSHASPINPNSLIETDSGEGEIISYEYDLINQSLKLDLKY